MLLAAYANKMMRPAKTLADLLMMRNAIEIKLKERPDVGLEDVLRDLRQKIREVRR